MGIGGKIMEKNPGISCAFYTVKQLASLFGKSEDTIRRWKNEGVGREDDNIKLRAVEREDGFGRKNARHLVFSREAVIEFVKANPFLMDDAPQLGLMMQAEGAWNGGAIPLGGNISDDEIFEEDIDPFERSESPFSGMYGPFEDRRPHCEPPRGYFRRPIPDFDEEDEFEEEFCPPRRPARRRRSKDVEDREAMVDYIESVLQKQLEELEAELSEVKEAAEEMTLSSDFRGSATVRKLLIARKEEIDKNIRYLEEFLDYIEEERS